MCIRDRDDRIDAGGAEDLRQALAVLQVEVMERHRAADDAFDAPDRLDRAVDQVVDHHHLVAGSHQFDDRVGSDVAGTAGDQDGGHGCDLGSGNGACGRAQHDRERG